MGLGETIAGWFGFDDKKDDADYYMPTKTTPSFYDPNKKNDSWFGDLDIGDIAKTVITTGYGMYQQGANADKAQAALDAQQAMAQQQFDAEMAYKYAALAARGGGGGGGASQAKALALQEQRDRDNLWMEMQKLRAMKEDSTSQAMRNMAQGFQGVYGR